VPPGRGLSARTLRFLLATDPNALTLVLGVAYRTISRHLISKAGLTRATGETGAVTLVQRFGSALNLNVHFHMLFLDDAHRVDGADPPAFCPAAAPGANELQELVEQIAARVGQVLERRGLIERDIENAWLSAGAEPGPHRRVLLACRRGHRAPPAREARTAVPLREPLWRSVWCSVVSLRLGTRHEPRHQPRDKQNPGQHRGSRACSRPARLAQWIGIRVEHGAMHFDLVTHAAYSS
jgi:hypothetical protein